MKLTIPVGRIELYATLCLPKGLVIVGSKFAEKPTPGTFENDILNLPKENILHKKGVTVTT